MLVQRNLKDLESRNQFICTGKNKMEMEKLGEIYTVAEFKREVLISPGATALTRILSFAHSHAKFLVT